MLFHLGTVLVRDIFLFLGGSSDGTFFFVVQGKSASPDTNRPSAGWCQASLRLDVIYSKARFWQYIHVAKSTFYSLARRKKSFRRKIILLKLGKFTFLHEGNITKDKTEYPFSSTLSGKDMNPTGPPINE